MCNHGKIISPNIETSEILYDPLMGGVGALFVLCVNKYAHTSVCLFFAHDKSCHFLNKSHAGQMVKSGVNMDVHIYASGDCDPYGIQESCLVLFIVNRMNRIIPRIF